MKNKFILTVALLLIGLAAVPVQAFSITSLSVQVEQNGDAQIDVKYDLSLIEQSAVFLRIANPARELQAAFNAGSSMPTTVTSATSSSAQVLVPSFATTTMTGDKTIMTTPSLSFERGERALKNYWFAPLVAADFSPSITVITFPDGYKEQFYDKISIPSISHQVPTGS
jgi:hypothetical protein